MHMHSRLRRKISAAFLALATVFAMAACSNSVPDADGSSASGGSSSSSSLTAAIAAMPTSYDLEGTWAASNENYTIWSQTMVNLIRYKYVEKNGVQVQDFTKYEGVLADKDNPFTVSDGGKTYTFHLRKGVKSQAGNPFTAQDVYWSLQRKLNVSGGRLPQIANLFDNINQVQIVDDHTIAIHLHDVDKGELLLPNLTGQMGRIWDKTEMLKHVTPDDPWATKWAAQNTGAGYGPYTVSSVTEGQQLVLKTNPNYPLDKPKFTTIAMKVVADSGTRAQMLASGDVDVSEALSPSDATSIADKVQLPKVDNPTEFIGLTLVENKAPFNDQRVRQAFRYAVPYDDIIKQIYQGKAKASSGWITPAMGVPGLSAKPAYTYNPSKAKALLKEAGKTSVPVTLSVSSLVPDIIDSAVMISSSAKQAGFDVTVKQLSAADFASGRANKTFQALMVANRSQAQAPAGLDNFFSTKGDNNSAFAPTDEYTGLLDAAKNAGKSTSKEAAPHWQKFSNFLNDEASNLPMLYRQPNQAYSTKLQNMSYRYDSTVDYSILAPKS
ncbi:MAG: ABC transporter substrate-binding protein [Bifidobacterium tibiigranuli]|nr:ABC transporter substrate-binding protein [Bifidobacterium tibiigranuli]